METRTVAQLVRDAKILSACMFPEMPDYGASRVAKTLLLELAEALEAKSIFDLSMEDS